MEADVQGEGDLPPDTLTGDVRVVLKRFESKRGRKAWIDGAEKSCDEVRELFRLFLKGGVDLEVFFQRQAESDVVKTEEASVRSQEEIGVVKVEEASQASDFG